MHVREALRFLLRGIGAVAAMLFPVWLTLGSLGLTLGVPLVLAGVILAAPGLAVLHVLKRTGLRYNILVGALIGGLLGFLIVGTMPNSDVATGASSFNWRGATRAPWLAAPFGAWSGLVWWAFFNRDRLARLFSLERLIHDSRDWA